MPTRRAVLATALVAAARLALPARAAAKEGSYSFVLLGDLHLDRLEHHDMDWLRREKPNDVRQVENYSRITREVTPLLFAEVARQVAASSRPVPFVLQIGDFVEGLCGNERLARLHCEDAVAMVRDARLGAPMLLTKGNHDITGPGAEEAFDEILLPFTTPSPAEQVEGACYAVRHAGSLFCFFDAYRPRSLAWLQRVLGERSGHDRRVFFVIHPPVVPYTARCWHALNRPEQADRRAALLALLAEHDAVVLNGHLHKVGLLDRLVGARRFRQFSTISVLPEPNPRPRNVIDDPAAYGPDLVKLEERFSPDTVEARRATLEAERPQVRGYRYADAPGYAIVHVDDEAVEADLYVGLSPTPWRRVALAGAVA